MHISTYPMLALMLIACSPMALASALPSVHISARTRASVRGADRSWTHDVIVGLRWRRRGTGRTAIRSQPDRALEFTRHLDRSANVRCEVPVLCRWEQARLRAALGGVR